jgi:hypothetical protein
MNACVRAPTWLQIVVGVSVRSVHVRRELFMNRWSAPPTTTTASEAEAPSAGKRGRRRRVAKKRLQDVGGSKEGRGWVLKKGVQRPRRKRNVRNDKQWRRGGHRRGRRKRGAKSGGKHARALFLSLARSRSPVSEGKKGIALSLSLSVGWGGVWGMEGCLGEGYIMGDRLGLRKQNQRICWVVLLCVVFVGGGFQRGKKKKRGAAEKEEEKEGSRPFLSRRFVCD